MYGETLSDFRGGEPTRSGTQMKQGVETKVIRVVILGAGYAGAACAQYLERTLVTRKLVKIKVTVVDSRKGSVHKYAGARAAALGSSFAYRAVIPNESIVNHGSVVHKAIRFVDENKVIFQDKSELSFDYLVCATGARYGKLSCSRSMTC